MNMCEISLKGVIPDAVGKSRNGEHAALVRLGAGSGGNGHAADRGAAAVCQLHGVEVKVPSAAEGHGKAVKLLFQRDGFPVGKVSVIVNGTEIIDEFFVAAARLHQGIMTAVQVCAGVGQIEVQFHRFVGADEIHLKGDVFLFVVRKLQDLLDLRRVRVIEHGVHLLLRQYVGFFGVIVVIRDNGIDFTQ